MRARCLLRRQSGTGMEVSTLKKKKFFLVVPFLKFSLKEIMRVLTEGRQ